MYNMLTDFFEQISTISWSAGSLDGQWAFKYWPSTRSKVSSAIRLSGDLHGSKLAKLVCPGFQSPTCTPAFAQQEYDSTFIKKLRNDDGDSAYVPTTNVYSIYVSVANQYGMLAKKINKMDSG